MEKMFVLNGLPTFMLCTKLKLYTHTPLVENNYITLKYIIVIIVFDKILGYLASYTKL